jgi:hypothetical protein
VLANEGTNIRVRMRNDASYGKQKEDPAATCLGADWKTDNTIRCSRFIKCLIANHIEDFPLFQASGQGDEAVINLRTGLSLAKVQEENLPMDTGNEEAPQKIMIECRGLHHIPALPQTADLEIYNEGSKQRKYGLSEGYSTLRYGETGRANEDDLCALGAIYYTEAHTRAWAAVDTEAYARPKQGYILPLPRHLHVADSGAILCIFFVIQAVKDTRLNQAKKVAHFRLDPTLIVPRIGGGTSMCDPGFNVCSLDTLTDVVNRQQV